MAIKPSIKSAACTKCTQHSEEYWDSTTSSWKTKYYCTAKVKIKLNKKLKNSKGIVVHYTTEGGQTGGYNIKVKGTGTSFTASLPYVYGKKGQKVKLTISSYGNATYGATSKTVTKTVTIK